MAVAPGAALEMWVEDQLRAAGLRPRRRQTVQGARQADEFDIVVDVTFLGFDGTWVMECKDWSKKVDLGTVATFVGRVSNAGADKGIMVTTKGYQSGCGPAAENTNVLLLTAHEFETFISREVDHSRLRNARPRLRSLVEALAAMHTIGTKTPGGRFRRGVEEHFPSGPHSERYAERLQALGYLLNQVNLVLAGDEQYLVPDLENAQESDEPWPDDWYPTVEHADLHTFVTAVTGYLNEWEPWARALTPPH